MNSQKSIFMPDNFFQSKPEDIETLGAINGPVKIEEGSINVEIGIREVREVEVDVSVRESDSGPYKFKRALRVFLNFPKVESGGKYLRLPDEVDYEKLDERLMYCSRYANHQEDILKLTMTTLTEFPVESLEKYQESLKYKIGSAEDKFYYSVISTWLLFISKGFSKESPEYCEFVAKYGKVLTKESINSYAGPGYFESEIAEKFEKEMTSDDSINKGEAEMTNEKGSALKEMLGWLCAVVSIAGVILFLGGLQVKSLSDTLDAQVTKLSSTLDTQVTELNSSIDTQVTKLNSSIDLQIKLLKQEMLHQNSDINKTLQSQSSLMTEQLETLKDISDKL